MKRPALSDCKWQFLVNYLDNNKKKRLSSSVQALQSSGSEVADCISCSLHGPCEITLAFSCIKSLISSCYRNTKFKGTACNVMS